jgi:hypothetical protein
MEKARKKKGKVPPAYHCVHPYVYQWSGRCEGCRLTPLSVSLPDHYARSDQKKPDAALAPHILGANVRKPLIRTRLNAQEELR